MKEKEAVAELRNTLRAWRSYAKDGDLGRYIYYESALPVAETLLAALDRPEGTPIAYADPLGALIRCPLCGDVFDQRYRREKPADRPTELAGRTVDGWGWKAFEMHERQLHSEMFGRGQIGETSLPENEWLNYRDWQMSAIPGDYAFHILKDKEVARKWIHRGGTERNPIIRRVGWRKLREERPHYVPGCFFGQIFTAEEIYILPEEGMPAEPTERPPKKGDWILPILADASCRKPRRVHMVDGSPKFPGVCGLCVSVEGSSGWYAPGEYRIVPPPAERPPEKGDWVMVDGWKQPRKITAHHAYREGIVFVGSDSVLIDYLRIVCRAADPLRVGDKVRFRSTEGWISGEGQTATQRFLVNFSGNRPYKLFEDAWGWFDRKDLTLVEPVYDRPAEKDC